MKMLRERLRLYLVTDPKLCAQRGLVATVLAAVRGGATVVQLREKKASTAQRIELALMVKDALSGTGIPVILNDDAEAAAAADIDGLHIGQDDISAGRARDIIGPHKILGLSCETPDAVRAADPEIVDYLGLGPVFGTATKDDHKQPIGFDGLAQLVSLSSLPNVAIGGLKAHHVSPTLATGVDGLAVVSAICGQVDPEAATRAFITLNKERSK